MSTLDTGLTFIRTASQRMSSASGWLGRWFKELMPKGLYARALLIIIVPMVVLQSVVAFVFMERHWNTVTRRLSAAVVQDVAALRDIYKSYPHDNDRTQWRRIAQPKAFVSAGWMGLPSSSASIADFRSGEESFDAIRPCATMLEVNALIDPEMLVEIEAEAVIDTTT